LLNDRVQPPGERSPVPCLQWLQVQPASLFFILSEPSARSMAFRTPSLLPTTTQRLIKLDQGREFVSLRLGQSQFSRERVGIVCQDFDIVGGASFEAHF